MKKTSSIQEIAHALTNQQVGIFPCDTIWGLIAVDSYETKQKLIAIKKRDPKKSFIYLINSFKQLNTLIKPLSAKQKHIINRYWPGAITFIFDQKDTNKTIAIRYPDMQLLQDLIALIHCPLLSTSVNISSQKNCNSEADFPLEIVNKIDFLYLIKEKQHTQASTIVDLTQDPFKTLREGSVLFEN